MKKSRELLQWHPAFYAGIQIELAGEREHLSFENEHHLGTRPKQIDVLIIKKDGDYQVQKNIGRIFRGHNIVEYKSPADSLNIDDFYMVYAYACFYKADSYPADFIEMEDITITFVCHAWPRKLIRYLKEVRHYQIRQEDAGIYHVLGDHIPIQILVTRQLSLRENIWLSHLTDQIGSEAEAERLVEEYQAHTEDKLYQSVMDIIVRANREQFEEAKEMCEALRELFADELEKARQESQREGRREGRREGLAAINKMNLKLSELGRTEDILKAARDPKFQEQLLKEFHL